MSIGAVRRKLEGKIGSLAQADYRVTSEESEVYNCFAWALGQTCYFLDPMPSPGKFWPKGISRGGTLNDFREIYAYAGYVPCATPDLEPGYEKVALYLDADGDPMHAARQLANGKWTSKLGDFEDIEHATLDAVECDAYGVAKYFLRRAL